MKDSLAVISHSLDSQSTQKCLLEELLSRCLLTAQLTYRLSCTDSLAFLGYLNGCPVEYLLHRVYVAWKVFCYSSLRIF